MQKILTELRLESGLLTKVADKGIKLEDNGGIRGNTINENALGANAVCFGQGGTASGYCSTCSGMYGTASGGYSTHFGQGGTASGDFSTHFGMYGTASGNYSTCSGMYGTASGSYSTHFGMYGTASGNYSTHFGLEGTASGDYSACFGQSGTASGNYSTHFGLEGTASGDYSACFGRDGTASGGYSTHFGLEGTANRRSQVVISPGKFSANGDAQFSIFNMRVATTDDTQTTMVLPEHFFILDESTHAITIDIVCRQDTGASHAYFKRQVLIERTGGTTAIVGAVQTIGTDINASAYGLAITADDTNDRLEIKVTGAAATNLRWHANLQISELSYAD